MRPSLSLKPSVSVALTAGAVAGLAFFLRATADVFVPFAVAFVLVLAAHPVIEWFTRRGVPAPLTVAAVVVAALVLLAIAILLVDRAVNGVVQNLPQFKSRATDLVGSVSKRLGVSVSPLENLVKQPETLKTLAGFGGSTALSLLNVAFQLLLVVLYLIILLLGRRHLPDRVHHAWGIPGSTAVLEAVEHLEREMFRYLLYRTLLSLITAGAVWGILASYGVQLAGLWALLTFFAQYVPFIGPIVLSLLPVTLALVQFPDFATAAWIALWLSAWHLFVGFVLEPRVFSLGLSLNQTLVLLGLALFGWMWGIIGVLLWVPLMVALRRVSQDVPALEPLSILLGRESGRAITQL